jgi:fluoride exporter
MSPLTVLLVFVGGGAGSVARFGIGQWLPPSANGWPWATWWVNVVGCTLAGLLVGSLKLLEAHQLQPRALLLVGFCGGFTTFSAFAIESWKLFEDRPRLALLYVTSSVLVSLAACLAGLWLGRALSRT